MTCSCAVPLDHEFDDNGAPTIMAQPPVVQSCEPLHGTPGLASLIGDLRSVPVTRGSALWIADQGVDTDGNVRAPAAFLVSGAGSADCNSLSASWLATAVKPSPQLPEGLILPLDVTETTSGQVLSYQLFTPDAGDPLALRTLGFGVGLQTDETQPFATTAVLLWSADRPSFGSSLLRSADALLLFGCRSAEYLASDCFLGRVQQASVTLAAAYEYWAGDHWSGNVDDAAPVVKGVASTIAVRPDATNPKRLIMTYVTPLGSTLVARSALAPEGPWSEPVVLASCDFGSAGPEAFCSGGQQHPELAPPGSLALSYDAHWFTDGGASIGNAWPRLALVAVPADLP